MKSYAHHLLICDGGHCRKRARRINKALKRRLKEHNAEYPDTRILCNRTDCLGICQGGPIMVLYPDGVWYHRVDKSGVKQIFKRHIRGGKPVKKLIVRRMRPRATQS